MDPLFKKENSISDTKGMTNLIYQRLKTAAGRRFVEDDYDYGTNFFRCLHQS